MTKQQVAFALLAFILVIPKTALGQQVAGVPSLTIDGSINSFTTNGISGLGVNGIISNTNNTICIINNIEVQWGKVDTNNNNMFTAFTGFFTTTKYTIQPNVVTPNTKWNYSTASQANTLFNTSGWNLGTNEKYAANVKVFFTYYVPNNPLPKSSFADKTIVK